ncbi:beta-galactosidase-like [Culicoides brevitarsis]|uniref:beta-galactosidase-like n=1 Tax=Culicoides brevitarsis TaxID=469753 RepID=UPI00307BBD16
MSNRTFTIDYENDTFLKDGKPFRYVSGSFHYFRALPQKWREILKTMRAGGLNAVDIYIQWSLHNPKDGVYNFEGIANVSDVIEAAKEAGLYVILRPGPYICAEIDNGGVPFWLFNKYPGIQMRVADKNYMTEVSKWYAKLMPHFVPHFYGNGGPIIMVQVENEYGAFKKCDKVYKEFLRDETLKYTNDKALLFTVDRPFDGELECGRIENVFVTTDFGLANDTEVDAHWKALREVQPKGPLVNTEFYPGWLTHWQEANQRRPAEPLAATLRKMLKDGANVNFYMYFGGTNFGFWAGANDWGLGKYMADITSYDYDAPLDEAGNPTKKFHLFKDVIREFLKENLPETPELRPTMKLEDICLKPKMKILTDEGRKALGTPYDLEKTFKTPPTFEALNQFSGFVLYETKLPKFTRDPSQLVVMGLRDRATVYVDNYLVGVLSRENAINSLPISAGIGDKLQLLVENQGRINFQVADDLKGILGDVTLQCYDEPYVTKLENWTATGYDFEDYAKIEEVAFGNKSEVEIYKNGVLNEGPVIFAAEFDCEELADTYIDLTKWSKGVLFVNGINLGRYWPVAGPQRTNYIPKELLQPKGNRIVLLELQKAPSDKCVSFSKVALLDD